MQEPQNQAPDKVKAAFADNENSTNATENNANPGPARISIPGIPDHLQPLIQQQLNALDTRQVQWQGQVWPEQEMHWKIHEESARSASGEEGRQWVTQIQLTLPNLGAVNATLRFSNGSVNLLLDAEEEATRSTLGAASTQLIAAMSERGIKVAATQIKQPGQERDDAAG
jgi:flagellar hook-length control protein FliK